MTTWRTWRPPLSHACLLIHGRREGPASKSLPVFPESSFYMQSSPSQTISFSVMSLTPLPLAQFLAILQNFPILCAKGVCFWLGTHPWPVISWELFRLLVYSTNASSGVCGAKLKMEVGNSIQVSQRNRRDRANYLYAHLLPLRPHPSRQLESVVQLGLESRHPDGECEHPSWPMNYCTKCPGNERVHRYM